MSFRRKIFLSRLDICKSSTHILFLLFFLSTYLSPIIPENSMDRSSQNFLKFSMIFSELSSLTSIPSIFIEFFNTFFHPFLFFVFFNVVNHIYYTKLCRTSIYSFYKRILVCIYIDEKQYKPLLYPNATKYIFCCVQIKNPVKSMLSAFFPFLSSNARKHIV